MEGWKKWYIWIVAVFLLTAVVGKVNIAAHRTKVRIMKSEISMRT